MADDGELTPAAPSISSLVAIGVIAVALSFNLGFFGAVGLPFMGLFALQEHLLFSLSGLVIVIISSAAINTVLLAGELVGPIQFIAQKYLRWFFFVLACFVVFSAFEDESKTAASLGILFVFLIYESVTFLQERAAVVFATHRFTGRVPAFVLFVAATGVSGMIYGELRIAPGGRFVSDVAQLASGERLSIVRLGSDYALVTDGTDVRAVRIASLIDIRSTH